MYYSETLLPGAAPSTSCRDKIARPHPVCSVPAADCAHLLDGACPARLLFVRLAIRPQELFRRHYEEVSTAAKVWVFCKKKTGFHSCIVVLHSLPAACPTTHACCVCFCQHNNVYTSCILSGIGQGTGAPACYTGGHCMMNYCSISLEHDWAQHQGL